MSTPGAMVSVNCLDAVEAVGWRASVTVIVTLLEPAAGAVPVITPVAVLIISGDGSPVADQTYGVTPPVAVTVALYGAPGTPLGSDVDVIVSDASTVTVVVTS